MFIVTRRGQSNTNAIAGEALTNGDAVTLQPFGQDYKAFKSTVAGEKVDGFATVDPTDPNYVRFPITLDQFVATFALGAFQSNYENIPATIRVLVEQGVGLAETDHLVVGTYQFGQDLTSNGDGKLRKANTGEWVVATARQNKIINAGDRLTVEYKANLAQVA